MEQIFKDKVAIVTGFTTIEKHIPKEHLTSQV